MKGLQCEDDGFKPEKVNGAKKRQSMTRHKDGLIKHFNKDGVNRNQLENELKVVKSKTLVTLYYRYLFRGCIKDQRRKGFLDVYSKVKKYLEDTLDITNYIKALEQLDRVKLLLLNTEQKLAFDFIKPPNLANGEELACFEFDLDKDRTGNAMHIINYFIERAKNNDFDEKDLEMLPVLDPIIKKFIQGSVKK
jgi:hypothetical protein